MQLNQSGQAPLATLHLGSNSNNLTSTKLISPPNLNKQQPQPQQQQSTTDLYQNQQVPLMFQPPQQPPNFIHQQLQQQQQQQLLQAETSNDYHGSNIYNGSNTNILASSSSSSLVGGVGGSNNLRDTYASSSNPLSSNSVPDMDSASMSNSNKTYAEAVLASANTTDAAQSMAQMLQQQQQQQSQQPQQQQLMQPNNGTNISKMSNQMRKQSFDPPFMNSSLLSEIGGSQEQQSDSSLNLDESKLISASGSIHAGGGVQILSSNLPVIEVFIITKIILFYQFFVLIDINKFKKRNLENLIYVNLENPNIKSHKKYFILIGKIN